jgi:hypothetical protein
MRRKPAALHIQPTLPLSLRGEKQMRHFRSAASLSAIFCLLAQLLSISARSNSLTESRHTDVAIPAEKAWSQFRTTFPYHIQTLAIDVQSRTLVISEPPPHITLANLQEAVERYVPGLALPMSVRTTRVGVDGWVKDIVLQLPPMSESETRNLVDAIQQHVFHTTYKAYVMSLPVQRPAPNSDKLDLHVSFADVHKWLFEDKEPLSSVLGGNDQSADVLIAKKQTGVFFSKERGLVIWSISRTKPISAYLIEARQFALDSDIIVGAVNAGNQVLVVGRERALPVDVLPPLRTETIALLASVKDDELAQSYERRNIFSGKFNDREDWAPIYLSEALHDTEYGSLLNITDQLLKGWSMNGLVKYENFEYAQPQTWGKRWCFNQPLYDEAGAKSLTFNWNTKGVGYTTQIGANEVFALNRSGSLPTSYLEGVEQKPDYAKYEETGYDCFAGFGDPNLARVVQYAALYQIFQKFPVKRPTTPFIAITLEPPNDALTVEALRIIKMIVSPTSAALMKSSLSPGQQTVLMKHQEVFADVQAKHGDTGLRALAGRIAHPRLSAAEKARALELDKRLRSLTPMQMAGALYPSTSADFSRAANLKELSNWSAALKVQAELVRDPKNQSRPLFQTFSKDLVALKDQYTQESKARENSWIHTPSVVVSQLLGPFVELTGGHNVTAATTGFKVDPKVPQGTIRTIRSGNRLTFLVNPADTGRIPSLVRRAAFLSERADLTPQAEVRIRQALQDSMNAGQPPPPPHSRHLALLMPDTPPPSRIAAARGFEGKAGNGWLPERVPVVVPDEVRPLSRHGEVAVIVDRQPIAEGFEYTITTAEGQAIKAYSTPSAIDAVTSLGRNTARENPKVAFLLKGFNEGEARSFLYNADLHLKNNSLTGFVKQGDPTAYLTKVVDYDLPRVNVSEQSFHLVSEGQYKGLYELQLTIDLPPQVITKPTLHLKVQMFYRNALGGTGAAVKNSIRDFFGKPLSADSNMNSVIMNLAKELKTINRDAKSVMTIAEQDKSGIFILELRPQGTDEHLRQKGESD